MWSHSPLSRALRLGLGLVVCLSFGCWEQIDGGEWFPQMKKQQAIQAFEANTYVAHVQGFSPPDGTVPVGGSADADLANLAMAAQDLVKNPVSPTLESLKNGEKLFLRYCSACHGPNGHGNGLVAGPPFGKGPFGLVLPIGGPASVAKGLTDGHIYTTMSLGRGRMPTMNRIPARQRWDVVNYLRELNGQGGGK